MCQGYRARSQELVDALMKKQVKLHIAMETGVLWVKLLSDNMTQSRTRSV